VFLPDVNILVYAHRADEVHHQQYREWLEGVASASSPFALSLLVAAAFVRIVTNPRIFTDFTPLPVALGVVDAIVARPNCRVVGPGPDHWVHFSTLCREGQARGKLVADAQHAAVALENGCTLVSRDGDFARFEGAGLRWTHLVLG
jgi:toxin-antitoxin system PIN domain toxin